MNTSNENATILIYIFAVTVVKNHFSFFSRGIIPHGSRFFLYIGFREILMEKNVVASERPDREIGDEQED